MDKHHPMISQSNWQSWLVSIAVHSLFGGILLWFSLAPQKPPEPVEFEVIVNPTEASTAKILTTRIPSPPTDIREPSPTPPASESKKIFGISRKALVADSPAEPDDVDMKRGNTLAKEDDRDTLTDEEDLPIPADEFLVTRMPRLIRDVQATFPESARLRGIQGVVVLDLLIDQSGRVRDVRVVESPDPELEQPASQAAREFLFEAAEIGSQKVAVRIRYRYRFQLE